jgi:hypothetical protein
MRTRGWSCAVLVLRDGFIGGAIATEFMSAVAAAARQPLKAEAEQFVMVDGRRNSVGVFL